MSSQELSFRADRSVNPETFQRSLPPDLTVAEDRESEYCQRNGIELHRLANGLTIVGVTRPSVDTRNVSFQAHFPTGSDSDPENLLGITHITEHLAINRARKIAKSNYIYMNASTSAAELSIDIEGIGTTRSDKGIRPVLAKAFSELSLGRDTRQYLKEALPNEKEVVRQEIAAKAKDHNSIAGLNLLHTIFAPTNPLFGNILGTQETLDKITAEDIYNHAAKIFLPKRTLLAFYNDGDPVVSTIIANELKALGTALPNDPGLQREKFDASRYDAINPSFQHGQVYLCNTGVDSNLMTVNLVWIMGQSIDLSPEYAPEYSTEYTAHAIAFNLIGKQFESYLRDNGLTYNQTYDELGHKGALGSISVLSYNLDRGLFPTENDAIKHSENLSQAIRQDIKDSILSKGFKPTMDYMKFFMDLVPLSREVIFKSTVCNLLEYEQLVDIDASERRSIQINENQLNEATIQFANTAPAIVISGNWSRT